MTGTIRKPWPTWAAVALGLLLTTGPVAAQTPSPVIESPAPVAASTSGLSVHDAWTRESMMVDLAGAAYMVIRNDSDGAHELIAASSPAAGVVELHQTSADEDGAMAMAPVSAIPLPPHSETMLEPGGYHVMLIDLVEPLVEGAIIELTLEFAAADPIGLQVPVRATGPMSMPTDDGDAMKAAEEGSGSVQEPELTWAPLVTLPPIMEPPVLTPLELADGYALGDPDAPVEVQVWEDFQCPFCARFSFGVKPQIVEEYVETGQVRLVFRSLAFLGEESHWAAVAADLAAEQDRFWPFHDYLFANLLGENVGSFGLDRLLAIGEEAGLDMQPFREGLVLERARERFARIQAEAREDAAALGINATPTVTVEGVPLQAPDFATVSAAIDAALGQAGDTPGTSATEAPAGEG